MANLIPGLAPAGEVLCIDKKVPNEAYPKPLATLWLPSLLASIG
ncbi:MAG TPA: hypothetical protein VJM76_00605 [Gammaproteobacteria bacterium]|nr:hypothetical protein [Gammaproteobacteria bacterium]